jgi:recombinational DNA repair protein RecT
MSETKSLTLAQQIAKSPVNWSMGLVKSFAEKNPGLMDTEIAQRSVMSAATKVIGYMAEQGLKWEQIDTAHLGRIFLRLAITGLDAESNDWYAYSRQNKQTGLHQFDPSPSYQGERKLRIKYSIGSFGKIKDISALAIRKGDKLKIKKDLFGKVTEVDYDPIPFNQAEIEGFLGITLFEDGTTTVQEFPPEKILEYKAANPRGTSPAWEKWPTEMSLAKVIKHTAKSFQYELPTATKKALTEMDVTDIETKAERFEASEAIDITPDDEHPTEEVKKAVVEEQPKEPEQEGEQLQVEMPDCLK